MKKNYILQLFVLAFLFAFQMGTSQSSLANNEFGSTIQNWLNQHKDKYQLSENDLSSLLVSDAYYSKNTKINHVYVNQAYQGVKIHNAISSVAVRNNVIFHYGNGLLSDIASKVNTTTPLIDAQTAINSVVTTYNLGAVSNLQVLESSEGKYLFSNGGVSKRDIPVQLVYQTTRDGSLKLAWDLSIYTLNGKNWYSVRVDAVSGTPLETNDWIVTCNFGDNNHSNHTSHSQNDTVDLFKSTNAMPDGSSYNVFPIPAESPSHGPIQLVLDPSNVVASPFGWHDIDGASGPEYTITRGNNVWAQDDIDGNDDDMGISPDGGASLTFNFPFDDNQEAINYLNASLTNLFYMNNIMHDVWYQYGFDEASGNFQENNYGNGGVGGDFVFADGQDGSGLNNATFGTPAEGGNPGMTMFLWSARVNPLVVNGGTLDGSYPIATASFGGTLGNPITGTLGLVVDDNASASTDANDACDAITNGGNISGKIAILRRGSCEFGVKVVAAENQGAIAVVVVNNIAGAPTPMGPGAVGDTATIPSVMVSQADGEALISAINNGETISVTLSGGYQRDGSLDNGIVAHEYGHGISSRLAGGPSNPNCLNNAEQMGEGWSDWFALMLTMKASDLPETGRGIATYSNSQPIDGGGIRPFKYTTDTAVNPLTYADTNDATNISQPHGIGSIWATMLWDLTWKYIEKYGFDPDVYNGTGGNNKIMQLVIDGLKLQNCNAGFVGGRAGLLAADMALTNGEDQCMIWEVFAARGLGLNASQGTAQSRTDQVEDFNEPPASNPTLQNCTSLSVDEFKASNYSIYPNPTNDILNIKVKRSFGEVKITLSDINGRVVLKTTKTLNDNATLNIGKLQSGLYILTIKGEAINTNDKILKK